jgi:hypothetical protein
VLCLYIQGANISQLERDIGSDQFPPNEHYFGLVNVSLFFLNTQIIIFRIVVLCRFRSVCVLKHTAYFYGVVENIHVVKVILKGIVEIPSSHHMKMNFAFAGKYTLSFIMTCNCVYFFSSLAILATAILSFRLYISVNHFEKKCWSIKQEIKEQKRPSSHALPTSSIALPHKRRKLGLLHQKSLLLDFEKRKVGIVNM